MKRFTIWLSQITKHKSFKIVLVVAVVATSFWTTKGFSLLIEDKKPKEVFTPFLMSERDNAAKLAAAPTSGPLQYSAVTTFNNPGSKSPKFVYYTTEYVDDRLIALNDKIITELKAAKKVNESTNSYSISYFDNKKVAKEYFEKLADKTTSPKDKSLMQKSYIATYVYSKQIGFSYVIKIGNSKIIKNYLTK